MTKGTGAASNANRTAASRSRRGILKGAVLAAGLVGPVVPLGASEIALSSEVIEESSRTAVLVSRVIELLRNFRPAGSFVTPSNHLILAAFEDLMTHLDQVYGDALPSPEEVRVALESIGHAPFSLDEDCLSRHPKSVVPLLVLTDLLRNHGLCIRSSTSERFAAFLNRHMTSLLS